MNRLRPKTAYTMSQTDLSSNKYNNNDTMQITKLLGKNDGYFNHISNQCVCGLCTCGTCKCRDKQLHQQEGKPTISEYQKEFPKKHCEQTKANKSMDGFKDSYEMKFESTNRADFIEHKLRPQTSMKRPTQQYLQPFHSASHYQLTYIDKPTDKTDIIPQNFPTVMKELEFIGQSEYSRRYSAKPKDQGIFINFGAHSNYGNPINPSLPFYGKTTSQRAFRPFKLKKSKGTDNTPSVQNIPSFYGQFQSTTKRDYSQNGLQICPARRKYN